MCSGVRHTQQTQGAKSMSSWRVCKTLRKWWHMCVLGAQEKTALKIKMKTLMDNCECKVWLCRHSDYEKEHHTRTVNYWYLRLIYMHITYFQSFVKGITNGSVGKINWDYSWCIEKNGIWMCQRKNNSVGVIWKSGIKTWQRPSNEEPLSVEWWIFLHTNQSVESFWDPAK